MRILWGFGKFRNFLGILGTELFVQIVVAVAVVFLTGALGYQLGAQEQRVLYEKRVKAAPERYLEKLDELLNQAVNSEGGEQVAKARSMLIVRDLLRNDALGIARNLNSEFEDLAQLVKEYEDAPSQELEGRIRRMLKILTDTWSSKKIPIEEYLRRLINSLGLYPVWGEEVDADRRLTTR